MGRIRSSNAAPANAADVFAVDAQIDDLLINWGRWATGRPGGNSATGIFRLAGRGRCDTSAQSGLLVDQEAARRVELTVCHPAFSERMKSLLKAHYAIKGNPLRTCKALGLHHDAYAEWVWRATVYFAERYRG